MEKLEKQFNRTRISINDMEQTIKFLEHLQGIPVNSNDIIRSALLVAAIISYSRPFSNNSEDELATGKQQFRKKEELEIIEKTDKNVFDYHKKIIDLRNHAIAHSEYKENPTRRVPKYSSAHGFVLNSRFFNILSIDFDILIFMQLSKQAQKIFENRLFYLGEKISDGENNIK